MLSRRKKVLIYLVYLVLCVLLFASGAELLARVTGHQPWLVKQLNVRVEPGGRLYVTHPTLGYSALPGQFKVTLDDSYVFTTTNLSDSLRATHPVDSSSKPKAKPQIWIFGDSITYGWSVNDEETFPWLLQKDLPNYEVVNFGFMGYGTLHSLIQLREAFQHRNKPRLIILNYASWQDVRNTFIRGRRKMLAIASSLGPVNQPYAGLTKDGKLIISMDTMQYHEFPLMRRSAFVNMLEETYDKYEERHVDSHAVTKDIVKEIANLCRSQGVKLIIATITSDPTTSDMLEFAHKEGLKTVDMFVDLSVPANNNLPFDSHPSALAHRQYAQLLRSRLLDLLAEETKR
jgi:hypothetical protein